VSVTIFIGILKESFVFVICSCILKDFEKVRAIFASYERLVFMQGFLPSSCLSGEKKWFPLHCWHDSLTDRLTVKDARILKTSRS